MATIRPLLALLVLLGTAPGPAAAQPVPAGPPTTGTASPRPVTVLVAYASMTGATEDMARAVEAGALSVAGTRVLRKPVATVTPEDLAATDAVIVGTAVHNAGLLPEVAQFFDRWPFEQMNNRVGAAFVAAGGTSAGEELATMGLLAAMLVHRLVVVGGETWHAAFGASAITEEGQPANLQGKVPERDREEARALGKRVATLAHALARGGWPGQRP
jgi:NAD(P)H dehydrogenase (quinone)